MRISSLILSAVLLWPMVGGTSPSVAHQEPAQEPGSMNAPVGRDPDPGEPPEVVSMIAGSGSFPQGATERVRVLCPAGMVALGGGVDPGNVLTMTVTQSAPVFGDGPADNLFSQPSDVVEAPVGWEATVRNDDSIAHSFKAAAICSDDTSAGTFISDTTVTSGGTDGILTRCPDGTICTSAGVEPADTSLMRIHHVTPFVGDATEEIFFLSDGEHEAPRDYSAAVTNADSTDREMKVAVVFTGELDSLVTLVASGSAPGSSFGQKRVPCPAGMVAVGGGFDPNASGVVSLTSSGPAYGDGGSVDDRLLGQADGLGPAPAAWRVTFRNETASPRPYAAAAVCSRRALRFFHSALPPAQTGPTAP